MSSEPITINTREGRPTSLDAEAVAALRADLRGELIGRSDPSYDAVRELWNGMVDKRPSLIARCTGAADVVAAVRFARANDLLVAVRGRGHNVAGNALADDGLVIDLSGMKGVVVDANAKRARVQPGADWGIVDHETQLFGLVTPGGQISTTGVAGFTLGGGMGFLRRRWGLACDNLTSVDIATASGELLTANAREHPDLFWAVRGGGGNFGVVTSFEFQLHDLGPEVYAVATVYPMDQASRVIRGWREYALQAPEVITCDLFLWGMPPLPMVPEEQHWAPVVIVVGLYAGPPEEAEAPLKPLRELGTPLADLSGPRPYVQFQSDFDPLFPDGLQYYWKSLFLNALQDDALDALVELGNNRPSPQTLLALRTLGGAMSRVPETATAYGNRDAMFNLSIDCTWDDVGDTPRIIDWARSEWQRMRDMTGGGVYLNFAGLGENNEDLVRAAYAHNGEKLARVKRRYDPNNLFRGNINITPANAEG